MCSKVKRYASYQLDMLPLSTCYCLFSSSPLFLVARTKPFWLWITALWPLVQIKNEAGAEVTTACGKVGSAGSLIPIFDSDPDF